MTERMFAILCVIIMGLTRCYKKTLPTQYMVQTANGISIGSAVFTGLTIVTDRQTTLLRL